METKDKIGDIIEELKRLQVEHGDIKVRKEVNSQLQSIWPRAKEINRELFIVF